MGIKEIRSCRSCGSYGLAAVLNLGNSAIIKFKNSPEEPDDSCPLILTQCEKCKLVQLTHTVERDRVFRDSYGYRSGINQTMRDALADVVETARKFVKLEWNDVVYDIGSNDDTLLNCYPKFVRTVGFEPSNTDPRWMNYESVTIPYLTHFIVPDYFSYEKARLLEKAYGKKPKIITACAMFYSVENPNQFCADIKQTLADDGIFILQVNYLGDMVENLDFSDVVHEHIFFYSLSTLRPILERNGLGIVFYEFNNVNGGSMRLLIKHGTHQMLPTWPELISNKNYSAPDESNLSKQETWTEFQHKIRIAGEKSRAFLLEKKRQGKKIWALGASTRGNTVLQYFGLDHTIIDAISDRNQEKKFKFMAGTNIPIHTEEAMREARPDYVILMNPSFKDEFVARESTLLKGNTKFLVLLPEIQEIGAPT